VSGRDFRTGFFLVSSDKVVTLNEHVLCVQRCRRLDGSSAAMPAHSDNQENFRPSGALPFIGAGAKGETGGAPFFFLFLSAFGFFFSRLLLN
jgi:hypothetical protein